jgi:ABC-type branched-subunit amino acid transport system permease subunit
MLVLSIACLALNLVYGTAGMLSLGHATFFGVAAYTGAFLYRFSAVSSFELYLLSRILSSTVFAAVIGFLCVRTTKIFLSILTLALSMVVYSLVIDGAVFRLFGGIGWGLYLLGGGSMSSATFHSGESIRRQRVHSCFLQRHCCCVHRIRHSSVEAQLLAVRESSHGNSRPRDARCLYRHSGVAVSMVRIHYFSPGACTGNWRVRSHLNNSIGCSRRNWSLQRCWAARGTSWDLS